MRHPVIAILSTLLLLASAPVVAASDVVNIPAGQDRLASLIRAEHVRVCGSSLTRIAQHNALDRWRAQDMLVRDYFSHSIPGGSGFTSHFKRYGIEDWTRGAEIIASNTNVATDAAAGAYAYQGFMGSSGHRAAIRDCAYNTFGVGAYREGSQRVFAVTFSRQPTERTTTSVRVRSGPGTSYATLESVRSGTRQIVLRHRTDSSGRRWDEGYISGNARGWVLDSQTR